MNKWRDSCIRSQDHQKSKFEKLEKECLAARTFLSEKRPTNADLNFNKNLINSIESIVAEKEPLIISLISTVYEDLKSIHTHLNAFCS